MKIWLSTRCRLSKIRKLATLRDLMDEKHFKDLGWYVNTNDLSLIRAWKCCSASELTVCAVNFQDSLRVRPQNDRIGCQLENHDKNIARRKYLRSRSASRVITFLQPSRGTCEKLAPGSLICTRENSKASTTTWLSCKFWKFAIFRLQRRTSPRRRHRSSSSCSWPMESTLTQPSKWSRLISPSKPSQAQKWVEEGNPSRCHWPFRSLIPSLTVFCLLPTPGCFES